MNHIRAKAVGVLIAVLALGAAVTVPGMAVAEEEASLLAEESCPSGNVCSWNVPHYQNTRGDTLCTGGLHTLAAQKESGKNRCANKASWLRIQQIAVWCLNPGQNLTEGVEGYYEIWIGAEGSRC